MTVHPRQQRIAAAFGRQARVYDRNAALQRDVAGTLSKHFPAADEPRILEIGCGTGLLTRHVLAAYPRGDLLATDIAPAMVEVCRGKFAGERRLRFAVLDAERVVPEGKFDLIVSSMVAQWFSDPVATLHRLAGHLAPGGRLFYATTGPDNLLEWRGALDECGIEQPMQAGAGLPGIIAERFLPVDYGSALAFLQSIKAIGASVPCDPAWMPKSPGALRRAMRAADIRCGGRMSWHIVFGRIEAAKSGETDQNG